MGTCASAPSPASHSSAPPSVGTGTAPDASCPSPSTRPQARNHEIKNKEQDKKRKASVSKRSASVSPLREAWTERAAQEVHAAAAAAARAASSSSRIERQLSRHRSFSAMHALVDSEPADLMFPAEGDGDDLALDLRLGEREDDGLEPLGARYPAAAASAAPCAPSPPSHGAAAATTQVAENSRAATSVSSTGSGRPARRRRSKSKSRSSRSSSRSSHLYHAEEEEAERTHAGLLGQPLRNIVEEVSPVARPAAAAGTGNALAPANGAGSPASRKLPPLSIVPSTRRSYDGSLPREDSPAASNLFAPDPVTPALKAWMSAASRAAAASAQLPRRSAFPEAEVPARGLVRDTSQGYVPLFVPATPLPPYLEEGNEGQSLGLAASRSTTPLPMSPQGSDGASAAALSAAMAFQPNDVCILLCDPDGRQLEDALQAAGYSVVRCDNAAEAIDLLQSLLTPLTSPDPSVADDKPEQESSDFDFVICDAQASLVSGGVHLLDWLAAQNAYAGVPVLVSSDDCSIAATERWLRRGATDVLRKPLIPALVLNSVFTLAVKAHQERVLLPALQRSGDRYKQLLLEEKSTVQTTRFTVAAQRSRLSAGSPSPLSMSITASAAAAGSAVAAVPPPPSSGRPMLLNVLLLMSGAGSIEDSAAASEAVALKLLDWLGADFLLNLVPCSNSAQVLACLEQPRLPPSVSPSPHAAACVSQLSSQSSRISNRLVGSLGADLLLLDEGALGDGAAEQAFLAALTSRDESQSSSKAPHRLVCPIMLCTDGDSSTPPLSLLRALQRSLVGVLELPLSASTVRSRLAPFLTAVLQHRRRFQLAQRALAYRTLLARMRQASRQGTVPGYASRSASALPVQLLSQEELERMTSVQPSATSLAAPVAALADSTPLSELSGPFPLQPSHSFSPLGLGPAAAPLSMGGAWAVRSESPLPPRLPPTAA